MEIKLNRLNENGVKVMLIIIALAFVVGYYVYNNRFMLVCALMTGAIYSLLQRAPKPVDGKLEQYANSQKSNTGAKMGLPDPVSLQGDRWAFRSLEFKNRDPLTLFIIKLDRYSERTAVFTSEDKMPNRIKDWAPPTIMNFSAGQILEAIMHMYNKGDDIAEAISKLAGAGLTISGRRVKKKVITQPAQTRVPGGTVRVVS